MGRYGSYRLMCRGKQLKALNHDISEPFVTNFNVLEYPVINGSSVLCRAYIVHLYTMHAVVTACV